MVVIKLVSLIECWNRGVLLLSQKAETRVPPAKLVLNLIGEWESRSERNKDKKYNMFIIKEVESKFRGLVELIK